MRRRGLEVDASAAVDAAGPGWKRAANERLDSARRLLISFQWKMLVFSCLACALFFCNVVVVPAAFGRLGWKSFWWCSSNYVLVAWLSALIFFNFFQAQHVEPGDVREVQGDRNEAGASRYKVCIDALRKDTCADKTLCEQSFLYAPAWCASCKCYQPPRTHHCSQCQRCVLRMECHSFLMGGCIGVHNHGYFLVTTAVAVLYLFYLASLCILAVITNASVLAHHIMQEVKGDIGKLSIHQLFQLGHMLDKIIQFVWKDLGFSVLLVAFLSPIVLVLVAAFGVEMWWYALRGCTGAEVRFPMREYVELKPEIYVPLGVGFYKQTWQQNLESVLGARWWIRFLLPVSPARFSGCKDQLSLSQIACPGKTGVDALRQRYLDVREKTPAEIAATMRGKPVDAIAIV